MMEGEESLIEHMMEKEKCVDIRWKKRKVCSAKHEEDYPLQPKVACPNLPTEMVEMMMSTLVMVMAMMMPTLVMVMVMVMPTLVMVMIHH